MGAPRDAEVDAVAGPALTVEFVGVYGGGSRWAPRDAAMDAVAKIGIRFKNVRLLKILLLEFEFLFL